MRRVPQLDGLRGIAILMVFATHALRIPMLWMGVDLFFVLSGYLITGILLRLREQREVGGYWRPFYLRRARRILPPYVGFLIFAVLVIAPQWKHIWFWYAFFGANFPVALGRVPQAMAPLWSLAVEEQFYLIWPWIVLRCGNEWLRRVALAVVILTPLLRAAATPFFSSHLAIYSLTPFRADTLALGAFIAVAEDQGPGWIQSMRQTALWGCLLSGALLVGFGINPGFRAGANSVLFNSAGYSLSAMTFGSALIYVLGSREGWVHRLLAFPALGYMGRISYTFYLYHVAIKVLVSHYLNSWILVAVASLALTTAIAALSWHFLESPILKRRSGKAVAPIGRAVAA